MGTEGAGAAEGACGCCTDLRKAQPCEEHGRALKEIRNPAASGMAEKSSCRAEEQWLHCSPLSLARCHRTAVCCSCWSSTPVPSHGHLRWSRAPSCSWELTESELGEPLNAFSRQIGKPADHTLL